ncbi:MAG: GNAT family N-acetyltransferase [Clostridiales bacterium]|nr:GNAT family N-acetyltransferase [Clostridiales bacterium]
MGNRTVAENSAKGSLNATLQEVLDLLDAEDGKSFEEKKEEAIKLLRKAEDSLLSNTLVNLAISEKDTAKVKTMFWASGNVFSSDKTISLRQVDSSDRGDFLDIQREYSIVKSMLKEEVYCDMVWKEHTEDKSLMCAILKDETYIGYCGVNNTTLEPWEIAIEIKPEWTKQGIGVIAISAMLDQFKARLGKSTFKVRIDPSNFSSQKMFERLGAVPKGIAELWIHDQQMLEQCEEDNLHYIDDKIIAVAEKFAVEPRKLLSHVLEYYLEW